MNITPQTKEKVKDLLAIAGMMVASALFWAFIFWMILRAWTGTE